MTDISGPRVLDKLRRAWHKERRFVHVRGLCYFLIWLVVLILLDLAIEKFFGPLPWLAMRALQATNVAVLGWTLYFRWMRLLRPFNAVRLALQVEKRHPELKSLLVSYVQLSGSSGQDANVSAAMLNALKGEALRATEPLNFKEIVNYRELKRIFLFSLAVLASFGVTSVQARGFISVLFTNMLHPASQAYPTDTIIASGTANEVVPYGQSVTVFARIAGKRPMEGKLYVKSKDGSWDKLTRPREGEDLFQYKLDAVYQDFDYRWSIGDVKSPDYHVTVVPPPRVVDPKVIAYLPKYTRQYVVGDKTQEYKSLTVQGVPEGSVLEWQVHTDLPLAEAYLVRDHQKYRMSISEDGKLARARLKVVEPFGYRFEWKERSHNFDYSDEVRYFVQTQPDAPPVVSILYPSEDEKGTVKKSLEIAYKATDEYGLGNSWLVFSVDNKAEARRPIDKLSGVEARKAVSVPLGSLVADLKPEMSVSYWIEVSDNRDDDADAPADLSPLVAPAPTLAPTTSKAAAAAKPAPTSNPTTQRAGGPNVSRSPARRVEIVTPEQYMAYVLEKKARLIAEIGPVYSEETEADKSIRELLGQATTLPAGK